MSGVCPYCHLEILACYCSEDSLKEIDSLKAQLRNQDEVTFRYSDKITELEARVEELSKHSCVTATGELERLIPFEENYHKVVAKWSECEKENKRLREALIWTTGSNDFRPGGIAYEGALKIIFPLIRLDALDQGERK